MTQKELARIAGVSEKTICFIKKDLKITSKTLTDEDCRLILDKARETKELMDSAKEYESQDYSFTPEVRRIDKSEGSSLLDMLQDCKEQYVDNQRNIKRLQYEIDISDKMFRGNSNGTLQPLPQLTMIEKLQKINISLRNQISDFEHKLGIIANGLDDDPFN